MPRDSGRSEPVRPIIVKKVTIVAAGHHGGAWKVAYADFVTAMMAFFLLLWLLGATNEKQRKGLADYFTPTLVKLREQSAGSNGLLGGDSITSSDQYPNRAGQTGTRSLTIPRDAAGGPREGSAATKSREAGSERKKQSVVAQSLRQRIDARLRGSARMRSLARQVRVMPTPEGIRIDLVDDAKFSMFRLGTTILVPEAAQLLNVIATAVGPETGLLTIRGHTDALQWRPNDTTNNWALSAGRAEATRQALLRYGIVEQRFRQIEGVADREPLIADQPGDPRNRRISILLIG
jgi:chemotaxis protein MotB